MIQTHLAKLPISMLYNTMTHIYPNPTLIITNVLIFGM